MTISGSAPLRADARRNRDQLLAAARDVFVEAGPDAPLDDVARRAGVGIATLYRRFPDRPSLLRAVALDVLHRTADEARRALAEEPDPFKALARYMHRTLDVRISAVMPALVSRISMADEELSQAREAATAPVEQLIAAAHSNGSLRADATFADVGLMLVRLSRPLPGAFSRELDTNLAHRHLDLVLAGLRSSDATQALSGPALSLVDLQAQAPPLSTESA